MNYNEFILEAFRETESEIGILTSSEIEKIIKEKSPEKIENWLVRTGRDVKKEWSWYNA